MDRWDIFFSYARRDAARARPIAATLATAGLSVFIDEDAVRDFRSITRVIGTALGRSKVVVAYYSSVYATRPACQWELTAAYLAGQNEGDPRRRVIVINPEAGSDHIYPIELRDTRHWPASPGATLRVLADRIRNHVFTLATPIGLVHTAPTSHRRPLPRPAAPQAPAARIKDMWQLHSALYRFDAALLTHAQAPGIAVLHDDPDHTATAAVREYTDRFAGAYPGGIYWFDLRGGDPLPAFQQQLAGYEKAQTGAEVNAGASRPADSSITESAHLWVLDGLPGGLTPRQLHSLLNPHPRGSTIIITSADEYPSLGPTMYIEPATIGDTMATMPTPETISERERLAAFDLQVELATRVGVQTLDPGQGSLREALTSLHSLFVTTRDVLRGYGPAATAVQPVAEELLTTLRAFLTRWHPDLLGHEQQRPAEVSAITHEQAWPHAQDMRNALQDLQTPLRRVVAELAAISGSDLGIAESLGTS